MKVELCGVGYTFASAQSTQEHDRCDDGSVFGVKQTIYLRLPGPVPVKGSPDCSGKICPKFLLDLVLKVGGDEQATKNLLRNRVTRV